MTGRELFKIWAPPGAVWSRWAKPVLFAEMDFPAPAFSEVVWPKMDLQQDQGTAVVVDLPGKDAVLTGVALAQDGYRPVPLFNAASGAGGKFVRSALVDVEPVIALLACGARRLQELTLLSDAPPAFLLDANRSGTAPSAPGKFDNRSVVFPQDFPSANFLVSQGISRVLLFGSGRRARPASDLAHVLLRWQQANLHIYFYNPDGTAAPELIRVQRPSNFKMLWQRAIALMGLRRSSAGGFGSVIPEPSAGGTGRIG